MPHFFIGLMIEAKLDAGDDKALKLINKPADERLTVKTIIESIKEVKNRVNGTLALEVMLLRTYNGFTNT